MATITTTTAAATTNMRNPKDSMRSNWYGELPKDQWTLPHWFFYVFGALRGEEQEAAVPVYAKTEKVPRIREWTMHRWILAHIVPTVALNWLYVYLTGHNFSTLGAILFYSTAFKMTAIHEIHALRHVGNKTGYLDGDSHARDGVPNVGVSKTFASLLSTSTIRPIFTVFLAWRSAHSPVDANWLMVPVTIALYVPVLDFWFYWYHRAMHEVDGLWKFHRTHHLTKHPNALLTAYADTVQEVFDIAVVPLMAYYSLKLIGLPMGFYEWWFAHQYVMYIELVGHSGLRVYACPPNPLNPLLRYFELELTIEDHDLHHRKGWKSSGNYGKQTRIWDRLFGTYMGRIEASKDNIDWAGPPVNVPLIF